MIFEGSIRNRLRGLWLWSLGIRLKEYDDPDGTHVFEVVWPRWMLWMDRRMGRLR
jgi:hypothetical protein